MEYDLRVVLEVGLKYLKIIVMFPKLIIDNILEKAVFLMMKIFN
jgi:hypothetical protein